MVLAAPRIASLNASLKPSRCWLHIRSGPALTQHLPCFKQGEKHNNYANRHFSSSSNLKLKLAYDLHEPPSKNNSRPVGHPIVIMHGLFGSKKNNRSISKTFARDLNRPVYAIDLRNHGDSPHDPTHNYTVLAADVEEFIQDHNLQYVTLIGHSMGAKTAMTLALHKPELVANLIPVDNAPVDAALQSDFGKYVRGMKKIDEARVQKQSEADEILQGYEDALPIRQFLLTNLIRAEDESGSYLKFRIPLKTLAGSLDYLADFPYKDPDAVRFEKPTLIVRGTNSHYVADETLPIIGRFFPRFERCDIEGGHWIISENPNAFKEAVEEFLSDKA